MAIKYTIVVQQVIQTFIEYKEPGKSFKNVCIILSPNFFQVYPHFYVKNRKITDLPWQTWNINGIRAHNSI